MATNLDLPQKLEQWVDAGLIEQQTADRIRAFESNPVSSGMRWPVMLAIAFGAIMVGAGVLLFVAAHWDDLSPAQRFLLVLGMTSGFHLAAGLLMPRLRALGLALHGVGTVSLGGGIFLAGQIFNLQEHWPGGILLWAIGAALSWIVLRDWIQATLTALLIPAWIASEWAVRAQHFRSNEIILLEFLTLLAVTYLGALRGHDESSFRRALTWIGGIAIIPVFAILAAIGHDGFYGNRPVSMSIGLRVIAFLVAFVLPLLVAFLLRAKAVVWNVGFGILIFLVGLLDSREVFESLAVYALYAVGACLLVVWGLQEQRKERINLGVAGFAITIIVFYFSTVMDKLGRSASLIAFGLLFLLGGWKLEQLRRKLVARTTGGTR